MWTANFRVSRVDVDLLEEQCAGKLPTYHFLQIASGALAYSGRVSQIGLSRLHRRVVANIVPALLDVFRRQGCDSQFTLEQFHDQQFLATRGNDKCGLTVLIDQDSGLHFAILAGVLTGERYSR